MNRSCTSRWVGLIALTAWLAPAAYAGKHAAAQDGPAATRSTASETSAEASDTPSTAPTTPRPDLSGRKRVGKASFYAKRFAGREMANGAPMDPHGDNAASRTLPLGTTAKVTNIETGKSAVVTIADRGPYVDGRIVDLSPSTAQRIGITPRKGVSKVVVAPITVPLPNGKIKLGAAVRDEHPDTQRRIRLAAAGPAK